jgi:hypothetical protein
MKATMLVDKIKEVVDREFTGWGPEPRVRLAKELEQIAILHHIGELTALRKEVNGLAAPIPLLLTCPSCGERHVDVGEFASKSHHTHACQFCGMTWRPAIVPTVGVRFLPGFKDEVQP